jgi:hypothetical protein
MDKNNSENNKRRVSFAPEPQVMYIYPEEHQSSKTTETNESEMSVELTADYSKYIGLNLLEQHKEEATNFLDMDLDQLLEKEDDGPGTDAIQKDQAVLTDVEKEPSIGECTWTEVPEAEPTSGSGGLNDGEQEGGMQKETPLKKKGTRRSLGSPYRKYKGSPKRAEAREGVLQENLSNSAISNDTVDVEEIINTQDLRKMIPQAKREGLNITELLVSKGIRFLDSLVVSNTRRDTMSKSVNVVLPSQMQYYEKYVEPRTLFFQEFGEVLERRMKEQEAVNSELERSLSTAGTILEREDATSQLKALKAECRMRAKVDWYELRKGKELEYNQMAIDKKNELVAEYNSLMLGNQELEERLKEKREKNDAMEEQIRNTRSRMGLGADDSVSELIGTEGHSSRTENIKAAMAEQEAVIDSLSKELQNLECERRSKETEKRMLKESLERMAEEISKLEETYKSRNVTEVQLKEARQEFRTLSAIFNFELLRIEPSSIRFRMLEYVFSIGLGPGLQILACDVEVSGPMEAHPLYIYGQSLFDVGGAPFFGGVQRIALTCAVISSLCKEMEMVRSRHELECYIRDNELYIEVLVVNVEKCTRNRVLVVLRGGSGFEVVKDGMARRCSIYDSIGLISKSIMAD